MSSATIVRQIKKQARGAKYSWKSSAQIRIDPDRAMEEFRAIYQAHGGITPDAVVDRAADDGSPLHLHFEWDKDIAARAHWESQARVLLRAMVVVIPKDDGTVTAPQRVFVKLTPDADDPLPEEADEHIYEPRVYVPVSTVMAEPDSRHRYVRKAYRELTVWRDRYRGIAEFAAIYDAIDAAREKVS